MPINPLRATGDHRSQATVAAKKAREWTQKRDEHITALRAAGLPYREIAELVGISHTQVRNITERD